MSDFMQILIFCMGLIIGWVCTYAYFDLKHTVSEKTIEWVEKNDRIFRVLRNFIEKEHPEILEKVKNSL
jgi:hypothetical protein